jgi:hypothetical protein
MADVGFKVFIGPVFLFNGGRYLPQLIAVVLLCLSLSEFPWGFFSIKK